MDHSFAHSPDPHVPPGSCSYEGGWATATGAGLVGIGGHGKRGGGLAPIRAHPSSPFHPASHLSDIDHTYRHAHPDRKPRPQFQSPNREKPLSHNRYSPGSNPNDQFQSPNREKPLSHTICSRSSKKDPWQFQSPNREKPLSHYQVIHADTWRGQRFNRPIAKNLFHTIGYVEATAMQDYSFNRPIAKNLFHTHLCLLTEHS